MLVAALFRLDRVPKNLLHLALDGRAFQVGELHPLRGQDGHIAIGQKVHHAGVVQDSRHIRGDKRFPLTHADHGRRPIARGHDGVGRIGGDHADGVSAGQPARRAAHGILQQHRLARALGRAHFLLDEVGDDLGIGFGDEGVAFLRQLALQFQVVFDDAVMHHHDAPGAVSMRMGVLFGWPAMGRPTGVANAVGAVQRVLPDHFFQVAQLPGRPAQFEPMSRGPHSDTGGVISAVFQPPQAFQNDRDYVLRADISHDSAHRLLLYGR